tara:strand:- start:127 stop:711 length:585 start_codon:yes stop_codon:yes gene_type:complete
MEINKNSIVSKLCGIKCNLKLYELLEILGYEDERDEIIEDIENGDAYYEYWSFTNDNELACDRVYYFDDVGDEHCGGATNLLEKIFGEKYLMMVTSCKFYQEGEFNSSPTYCEHTIENKSLNIKYEFVTKDHHEGDTLRITNKNFLNENEKNEWEGYRKNWYVGKTYDHRIYFIKKSDFNIDKWWLGWTEQDVD